MNEIDKFFGDLPTEDKSEQDIFGENEQQQKAPEEGDQGDQAHGQEEGSEARKNRRHRRLEEQLKRERESNIALNERIRVLSEVTSSQSGSNSIGEMPPEWIALYGDTPEAKTAWALNERMFKANREEAKKEALAELQEQQASVARKQQEFETFIDNELEDLEDEFNVDLTSDSPAARKARREFLELVQKVSPKDEHGNVTSYADFGSTFELYKNQKAAGAKPDITNNRRKEIASRSMEGSVQNQGQNQKSVTPGFHGWKKDLGLM